MEWLLLLEIACIVAVFLLGLFTKNYLPSYMEKKGENLATKEDGKISKLSATSVKRANCNRKMAFKGHFFCKLQRNIQRNGLKSRKKGTRIRPERVFFRLNAMILSVPVTLTSAGYFSNSGVRTTSFARSCSKPKRIKKSAGRAARARS